MAASRRPRGTAAIIGSFALLALVPVVALGIGLSNAVNMGVRQSNLDEANTNLTVLVQAGIQPLLLPSDVATGLSAARLDELDYNLRGVIQGKVVSRLKIWNRSDVVVYSDNRDLVARHFPPDENLERALAGHTGSEISAASAPENKADNLTGTYLSVYVPIYFADQPQKPAGAVELYLPWAPVAASIDRESRRLYLLLAIGLSLLYISLIPIVLVADRWRRRLTASLDSGEETARVSELKSSFLASMSHEMRTPLNAVIGFAQLLSSPDFGKLDARQDRYVQNIERAGRHLLALTNNVLDLSKIEAGGMDLDLDELELWPIVRDAAEILHPLVAAKAQALRLDEIDLWVTADRLRVTQVIVNLLSNAIKFTPAKGSIRVGATQADGWVDLTIADSGTGIPVEEQTAVFDRFRQVDSARTGSHEGTGLGLPLSRRMVELMGGRLDLVESSAKGSTFRIRIPAATAPVSRQAPPARRLARPTPVRAA